MGSGSYDPMGEYPLDVYAARLRWLFRNPALEVTFDDWRAGPLAIARIGVFDVVYGGDAAEEGSIFVSIFTADAGEHVDDMEGETWDELRERVATIPVDVTFDATDLKGE